MCRKSPIKKFWIQFVTLVVIILAGTYLTFNPVLYNGGIPGTQTTPNMIKQLKVGETIIKVELANTPTSRQKGLSSRDSLDQDLGMLFVFPEVKKYRFWMKDVKFPLDFIFIREGKVVDIIKNVPIPAPGTPDTSLPVYEPVTEVDMMLEVNSGFSDSHSIKVGDSVSIVL